MLSLKEMDVLGTLAYALVAIAAAGAYFDLTELEWTEMEWKEMERRREAATARSAAKNPKAPITVYICEPYDYWDRPSRPVLFDYTLSKEQVDLLATAFRLVNPKSPNGDCEQLIKCLFVVESCFYTPGNIKLSRAPTQVKLEEEFTCLETFIAKYAAESWYTDVNWSYDSFCGSITRYIEAGIKGVKPKLPGFEKLKIAVERFRSVSATPRGMNPYSAENQIYTQISREQHLLIWAFKIYSIGIDPHGVVRLEHSEPDGISPFSESAVLALTAVEKYLYSEAEDKHKFPGNSAFVEGFKAFQQAFFLSISSLEEDEALSQFIKLHKALPALPAPLGC